jgi:hypothetical protein
MARVAGAIFVSLALASSAAWPADVPEAKPRIEARGDGVRVVHLTQSSCLFLEAEATPAMYHSTRKEDCEAVNRRTLSKRGLRVLRLPPGEYVFRVANRDVPYELGFWLRGQGIGRALLPSVSGGGIFRGTPREYPVTLVKGTYSYSCPLNPTPDYTLVVE